jgi:ribonuclease PH
MEFNNTKIICSVYGPRPYVSEYKTSGKVNCKFKFTTFSSKENRKQKKDEEDEFSQYLQEAIEPSIIIDKFPKSVVDIYVLGILFFK